MQAALRAIEYCLPEAVVSTAQLAAEFPDWPAAKIAQQAGVTCRHIAAPQECASDLAVAAAEKLFASGLCRPSEVDYLLLCTQSPDYFLPTTACLLQDRLGLPTHTGALDFNLGSSGYVYGLGLAQGLIASGQARQVLLLTAETYSKFIHPRDRSCRAIFGDAAAATWLTAVEEPAARLGPFVYGTDGRGAPHLIVPTGGMRRPRTPESAALQTDASGNVRSQDNLFMDGAEIFNFTLRVVPATVGQLLARAGRSHDDIDLYVFHQANRYILEHLRKRLRIPAEKFPVTMDQCGNTGVSSIPIALKHAHQEGHLKPDALAMLVGFGPGYSWGATLLRWGPAP
jgi:3-oxoacyl-[acyl-carrier-protein] synthase-3